MPGAAQPTAPVLAVSCLGTAFRVDGRWQAVVRGVSFEIGRGETLAIVGESGSGKSVTALSVMGLHDPAASRVEGSIRFGGEELVGLPESRLGDIRGKDIAMIFQEPMTSLNPVLSVGFQIGETLVRHRGLSRAAAEAETVRLLDRVRLPAAKSRLAEYPHRFSGGMRQRVMIAMALACEPQLLIADEPTTALDVTIQAQILELVKSLQRETNLAVMFITHDMGVVAEIADRTVVMFRGEAVETGSTAQIFAQPGHPYTRALLASVPQLGSMAGRDRPARFPQVGRASGELRATPELRHRVAAGETPVLDVRGLSTRFDIRSALFARVRGRVHAVENVSFSVQPGETLALVGESGCGKSTTGRSVMRLVEPQAGQVRLDGVDLMTLDASQLREQRRRIQMIFQDPFASLDPRMTVGAAIAEPLLVNRLATRAEAHAKAAGLLERVGLDPALARRYPHEFSGGQRQRVCIARALALQPRLIVADESVSALDVSVKAQVLNLMLELQERLGLAYLFISHDMAVVERISHRVAVMYLGEIVEIGPRASVFGNPQHEYTRRLLSAVPIADPARRRSAGRPVADEEIKGPVRPVDYVPPPRLYREVAAGHVVMG